MVLHLIIGPWLAFQKYVKNKKAQNQVQPLNPAYQIESSPPQPASILQLVQQVHAYNNVMINSDMSSIAINAMFIFALPFLLIRVNHNTGVSDSLQTVMDVMLFQCFFTVVLPLAYWKKNPEIWTYVAGLLSDLTSRN